MPVWLIVVLTLLGVSVIASIILLVFAGNQTVKVMSRDYQGFKNINMDISFYKNGPVKALAEEGLKYIETLEQKEVYLTSYDGLKLQAYIFMNKNKTNKFFLGMHGFKSGPLHEYAPYIKEYMDLGFNVILPCERAHYKSEGEYLTMGVKERYDVKSWCDYIVTNYGKDIQILVQGISMGAASVCLASNLDLPKQVIGIISDCAYSSIKEQMEAVLSSFKAAPKGILLKTIDLNLKRKVGISLKDESPVKAVESANVPMLFVHGKLDQMVPYRFACDLYEACGSKKKLYIVNNANHAESMARDKETYFKTIVEFFNIK